MDADQAHWPFAAQSIRRGVGLHRGRKPDAGGRLDRGVAAERKVVLLSCPAWKVQTQDGRVTGVLTPRRTARRRCHQHRSDAVGARLVARPADWLAKYDAIDNIGVCCLLFKLKRSVTPHFWVNLERAGHPDPRVHRVLEFSVQWMIKSSTCPITCRRIIRNSHGQTSDCSTRPSPACAR